MMKIVCARALWLLQTVGRPDYACLPRAISLNAAPPLNVVNGEEGIYSTYENIGEQSLPALYVHPNFSIQYRVYIPPQRSESRFTANIYVNGENLITQPKIVQDGVEFAVSVYNQGNTLLGREALIFDPNVDTSLKPFQFDLSAYTGMLVTLELSTDGEEVGALDWAYWVDGQFIFSR